MSNESLLIILGVGLIAGWLAGQIVQGTGLGIVGDLIVGIVGAFIGSWLLRSATITASIVASVASPCRSFSTVNLSLIDHTFLQIDATATFQRQEFLHHLIL